MKLGFVGMGNMATAMAQGIIEAGAVDAADICGSCAHEESARAKEQQLGVHMGTDNVAVVEQSDIVFLSCKPYQYEAVIGEVRGAVTPDKVIVTIAPGKTLAWLADQFGGPVRIVRCMPNTPALVGEGLTTYCPNEQVTSADLEQVEKLLDCFGARIRLEERLIDAASAVGGSAPAFVYAFIESLADGGVAEGLPRAQATQIAAQTVLGSAKMVLETGQHPGALKDAVCSPAGSTIRGMEVLEKGAFRGTVIDAVRTTAAASRGL